MSISGRYAFFWQKVRGIFLDGGKETIIIKGCCRQFWAFFSQRHKNLSDLLLAISCLDNGVIELEG
jgi:hypothetical protein